MKKTTEKKTDKRVAKSAPKTSAKQLAGVKVKSSVVAGREAARKDG